MKPLFKFEIADLTRLSQREFGPEQSAFAEKILQNYCLECERNEEVVRVQIACVKLAAGDLKLLSRYVDIACCDAMDVLLPAEYPRYAHQVHLPENLDETQIQNLIDEDTRQYLAWFESQ